MGRRHDRRGTPPGAGCLALNRPGPYQVQAAINAVHTDALDASMTDWSQVVALFDQLRSRSRRARWSR